MRARRSRQSRPSRKSRMATLSGRSRMARRAETFNPGRIPRISAGSERSGHRLKVD